MPRKRKHDPTIPSHIDQEHLPTGIYWQKRGRGRWVVFEIKAENGKPTMVTVATPRARLSDLQRIAEDREQGQIKIGTLVALCDEFERSVDFKGLAPKTQESYRRCRAIICDHPTKLGPKFGKLETDRLTDATLQRLIDRIASSRPTSAKRCAEYLRRIFRWGNKRGYAKNNPATSIEPVKLKPDRKMPTHAAQRAILNFAVERGSTARRPGTVAPYLWIMMELAYLCHMRGIEVRQLTEAHGTPDGVIASRTKGSRTSGFYWSPRLKAAWDAAIALRDRIWERRKKVIPIHAKDRPLLVNQAGDWLSEDTYKTAWQRMITLAIEEGVITKEERFSLHTLKRRGITDRKGTRHEKGDAGGHKTQAMLDVYDFSVPFFATAEGDQESDSEAPISTEKRL